MTDLNINCPGLEILKLEDLRLKGLDISGTGLLELQVMGCLRYTSSWAKILVPNLQWLYWKDTFNVKCVTDSFEDLNMGTVHFSYLPLSSRNPATLQSAASFISALCFARSLNVRSGVLKILSTMDSEDGLPFCFKNLTTLEIRTHLTKYRTTRIICLLGSSPILHTISIGVNCSEHVIKSWDDDQYWRSQSENIKSILHQLKVARIDVGGTKMPKSAFHLVEFLLRYETTLQEMTLTLKIDPVGGTRDSF
ncbi:uncharacterized protein LOC131330594 [Rhododendron vialii]|uniref:uncharacterized protein LOC131330594 n=1 Tax=Rhododendron vialii TaxID=182163 RepID=UPI0026603901|nr:uncharacterized protein LOC131330594 [Rhododendron vialii]